MLDILPQLIANSLIAGSVYALVSAGLAMVYGLLRILNFSHGHVLMASAYCYYYYNSVCGWSIISSGAATLVFAILIGIFSFAVFIQPFLRYNVLLAFVTTLTLGILLESIITILAGVNSKSFKVEEYFETFHLFDSVYITFIQVVIIVSAIVILSILAWFIHKTLPGRYIRALSQHRFAAEAIGIDGRKIYYFVYCLSAVITAYAGILIAYDNNISPTMGHSYSIKPFAVMILGGLGNLWGTIIGSYFLGLVENFSIGIDFWGYSLPAGYRDAISFLIILSVLIFKPSGIFAGKSRTI